MKIKLPIPLLYNGNLYHEADIKEYTAGILADTKKEIDAGNSYKALQVFIAGCIETIDDISDKSLIKVLCGNISYKTAEYLAIKIITQNEKEDSIEGIYACPRCGNKIICEYDEDGEIDTAHHLNDLKVIQSDKNEPLKINLKNKITIEDIGENIIDEITSIEIEHPTLNNCTMATNSYGDKDLVRLELRIYVEALKKVNNDKIDNKFKNRFGMYIMERLCHDDLMMIKDKLSEYGIQNEIKMRCPKCDKKFKAILNTASFFGSAFQ